MIALFSLFVVCSMNHHTCLEQHDGEKMILKYLRFVVRFLFLAFFPQDSNMSKSLRKASKLSFDIELSVLVIECRLATQMVHIQFRLGNIIWLIVVSTKKHKSACVLM